MTVSAIKSSRIVTPGGIRSGWLRFANEVILEIADQAEPGDRKIDGESWVIMPGLVDTHVHINEPGRTDWEGFATATRAAAAGGITTIVDMPLNCDPVTTSVKAFKTKLAEVQSKLHVDCGFYGGLVPGNVNDIDALVQEGVLGFKAFMVHSGIDDFPQVEAADLRQAMPHLANLGVPLLAHAEMELEEAEPIEFGDPRIYQNFLRSRPESWELAAIKLLAELSAAHQCRTHVVHLSAAAGVPLIQASRDHGAPMSVETCPHYLLFCAEEIADGDTRFKCAPPIRERSNQDRLWQALMDEQIDFVVSDHSPCAPQLKLQEKGDFEQAWGGISGLQFGLSTIWTQLRRRSSSPESALQTLARWLAEEPAKLVGLDQRKGKILPGYDADLVLWDPDHQQTISLEGVWHRHKVTPYAGMEVFGRVERTFVRGTCVFDGTGAGHLDKPMGVPIFKQ